ncbi:MAG: hypothetical protein ACI83B_001747 [Sediminicola sp.]|jgi:hypothetical protein
MLTFEKTIEKRIPFWKRLNYQENGKKHNFRKSYYW